MTDKTDRKKTIDNKTNSTVFNPIKSDFYDLHNDLYNSSISQFIC